MANYYIQDKKRALEQALVRVSHNTDKPKKVHLFLTKNQYECDPDWWHDVLRQRGLPDDAIVIVPSGFDTKGGSDLDNR